MRKRATSKGLLVLAVLVVILVGSYGRAYADDGIQGTFDNVTALVKDISTAVVRLLLVVSGGLFTLGVVRGAFDGVLGSTLGNTFVCGLAVRRGILAQLRRIPGRTLPLRGVDGPARGRHSRRQGGGGSGQYGRGAAAQSDSGSHIGLRHCVGPGPDWYRRGVLYGGGGVGRVRCSTGEHHRQQPGGFPRIRAHHRRCGGRAVSDSVNASFKGARGCPGAQPASGRYSHPGHPAVVAVLQRG